MDLLLELISRRMQNELMLHIFFQKQKKSCAESDTMISCHYKLVQKVQIDRHSNTKKASFCTSIPVIVLGSMNIILALVTVSNLPITQVVQRGCCA